MSNQSDTRPPKNMSGKTVNGIRHNNRKEYRLSTLAQRAERVEIIIGLLGQSYTNRKVIKHFKEQFAQTKDQLWNLVPRSVEIYLSRARAEMLKRQGRTKAEVKADAIAFYESMIEDPKADRRLKMDARKRLDEIFGIDAPKANNVRLSDPNGKALAPTVVAPIVQFVIPNNGREKQKQIQHNGNGHNSNRAEAAGN